MVVPFDAVAIARAARFGLAGVADEEQLRVQFERPQGERALQPGDDLGARSELETLRANQRVDGVDGRALRVFRGDRGGGAAGVVAVETVARIGEKFSLAPRSEDQ